MTRPPRSSVRVHDTDVVPRSPVAAALLCIITLGVTGAVRHGKLNGELRRLGRARGSMTFPFIRSTPALSVLTWILGLLLWAVVVFSLVTFVRELVVDRRDFRPGDITSVAGTLIFLAPLWLTSLHTGQRIRTAQHLLGITPRASMPLRLAAAAVVFPPLGLWRQQREPNRAYATWRPS
ncbi:MAG: hypothetical protein H7287_06030 [Thermoleophilia bacterium]|nr:hypothetical protein [Thermoleophilia bacterium]